MERMLVSGMPLRRTWDFQNVNICPGGPEDLTDAPASLKNASHLNWS